MADLMFWARIEHIVRTAIDGLSDADRNARIEHCRHTGEHGVRMLPDADGLTLRWGGRTLAVVDRALFDDDAYLEPVRFAYVPAVPDDARDLTHDRRGTDQDRTDVHPGRDDLDQGPEQGPTLYATPPAAASPATVAPTVAHGDTSIEGPTTSPPMIKFYEGGPQYPGP